MADKQEITGSQVFRGEDKLLTFVIYEKYPAGTTPTTVRDITGWTISWMLKRNVTDLDAAAKLTKAGVISGVFNASPATNTQKVTVTIDDTDLDGVAPNIYRHELKRTDPGTETVLTFGPFEVTQGVHRT